MSDVHMGRQHAVRKTANKAARERERALHSLIVHACMLGKCVSSDSLVLLLRLQRETSCCDPLVTTALICHDYALLQSLQQSAPRETDGAQSQETEKEKEREKAHAVS